VVNRQAVVFVALEIALIVFGGTCLWLKIFLPMAYYTVAISVAAIILAQIAVKKNPKYMVFQIGLIYLFLNIIYYLATNYNIIPFWDGNWDFAVTNTFLQDGRIFPIIGSAPATSLVLGYHPAVILQTYSGWPLLHSLALSLSSISGIDAFHIAQVLPLVISAVSFMFVFLIVERLRSSLGLDNTVTYLALLIYATSAESLFYQVQFIRQNLGIMLFFIVLYTFYLSITKSPFSRKYQVLMIFFTLGLVAAHHFSSFLMISFLFAFFVIQAAQKGFERIKLGKNVFSGYQIPSLVTFETALIAATFLFGWWTYYSITIWRNVNQTLTRFIAVITGSRQLAVMPNPSYYPAVLQPSWATSLLLIRDLLIYAPVVFGLLFILRKKPKSLPKGLVVFSSLAFGLIIVIDYFTIKVEAFRIFSMAMPIIALLSATFLAYIGKNWDTMPLKRINLPKGLNLFKRLFVFTSVPLLILAAFVGLWGHQFAPMHLYDPSITYSEVGERNVDYMRANDFFSQNIQTTDFQVIWADDDAALVSLLSPNDYNKIVRLDTNFLEEHSSGKLGVNELVCGFNNLNLYHYYSGVSATKTPEQGKASGDQLQGYLDNNFTRIYDDGKSAFWVSEVS
jgi:hypothetical protein